MAGRPEDNVVSPRALRPSRHGEHQQRDYCADSTHPEFLPFRQPLPQFSTAAPTVYAEGFENRQLPSIDYPSVAAVRAILVAHFAPALAARELVQRHFRDDAFPRTIKGRRLAGHRIRFEFTSSKGLSVRYTNRGYS